MQLRKLRKRLKQIFVLDTWEDNSLYRYAFYAVVCLIQMTRTELAIHSVLRGTILHLEKNSIVDLSQNKKAEKHHLPLNIH